MNIKNLIGRKFGRVSVISRAVPSTPAGKARWNCKCSCGREFVTIGNSLLSKKTTNCGCVRHQKLIRRNHRHGLVGTRAYNAWAHIKARCTNQSCSAFQSYGGRGITICKRWENSFQAFFADMGHPTPPADELERVDNNGPYSPDNCRWATRKEQCNNKRTNIRITHNGKTKTLKQWTELLGLKYERVRIRLKHGWTFTEAISLPKGSRRKHSVLPS